MDAPGHRATLIGAKGALALLMATAAALVLALSLGASRAAAEPTPEKTDVTFIFDTSGSMGGELQEAKENILTVMEEISHALPNVEYGVSNVEDVPGWYGGPELNEPKTEQEYEEYFEKAWKLDQPLTTETGKVVAAINALTIGGGGDGPEAYSRALWETDTNPNVGWRPGARHEIVLIADNVPHEHELNEGLPESVWVESPFNTGEEPEGKFGIPGTQWTPGTNLKIQSVATQLGEDGKPLQSVEFYGGESGYLPYWEYWASLSGGQALNGGTGELAAKLTSAIETGATKPFASCGGGKERSTETGVCIVIPKPASHATSTAVSCSLVIATASDLCTATVTDIAAAGATNPTGAVTFTSSSGGVFSAGSTCTLAPTPMSSSTSSCSVVFLPPTIASPTPAITATYVGDSTHNSSIGSGKYPGADELAGHIKLGGTGKILPGGGKIEVPIECGFPCIMLGKLFTGPGLAGLASVSHAEPVALAINASSHGKKKKHGPALLGKGTLKLGKVGKGKLTITLSGKSKQALARVGKNGVRVTLKVTIETAGGTLVGNETEHITLKPVKKKHHH